MDEPSSFSVYWQHDVFVELQYITQNLNSCLIRFGDKVSRERASYGLIQELLPEPATQTELHVSFIGNFGFVVLPPLLIITNICFKFRDAKVCGYILTYLDAFLLQPFRQYGVNLQINYHISIFVESFLDCHMLAEYGGFLNAIGPLNGLNLTNGLNGCEFTQTYSPFLFRFSLFLLPK